MVPKTVEIVQVDGIGPGLGLSVGNRMFKRMLAAGDDRLPPGLPSRTDDEGDPSS